MIDFNQLMLLALHGTALHWLFARSAIMKWFWDMRWWPIKGTKRGLPFSSELILDPTPCMRNNLREVVSGLLACSACAGFWLGIGAGALGVQPLQLRPEWLNILGSGLSGIVAVPILEGALLWGLERTHID